MSGVRVCGWSELVDGAARRVVVDGRPVALVRIGERVHAIDDVCSHAEVSLSEGDVDVEECALDGGGPHAARYQAGGRARGQRGRR